jgi:hypothetical protein
MGGVIPADFMSASFDFEWLTRSGHTHKLLSTAKLEM